MNPWWLLLIVPLAMATGAIAALKIVALADHFVSEFILRNRR